MQKLRLRSSFSASSRKYSRTASSSVTPVDRVCRRGSWLITSPPCENGHSRLWHVMPTGVIGSRGASRKCGTLGESLQASQQIGSQTSWLLYLLACLGDCMLAQNKGFSRRH